MSALWSYALAAIGVTGLFIAATRPRVGWWFNIVAQAAWVAYAVATPTVGLPADRRCIHRRLRSTAASRLPRAAGWRVVMTDPSAVRGNQIYEPRRVCRCDHGETVHDLNSKKVRAACSHVDAGGTCGCRTFEEAIPGVSGRG